MRHAGWPWDALPIQEVLEGVSPGLHAECLTSASVGGFRKAIAIAAAIITKQSELTEDMFQSPYVVAGGND